MFNNINAYTSVYKNAVQKSASKIASNAVQAIANFEVSATCYTHNATCYSLLTHKTTNALYLYAIYNNAKSMYFINNVQATKQQVALYLTASAAATLLQQNEATYNATNNVTHNVTVRTLKLASIVSITAQKQTVSV